MAESFDKPLMNDIINHILQLKQRHHCTKVYVDSSNPEVIRELKNRIGEYHDYYGWLTEQQIWALQICPVSICHSSINQQEIQADTTLQSRIIRVPRTRPVTKSVEIPEMIY